ncbi:methyltransferase family protein [Saccharothrix saharensis]|uniref:Methyltransferase family protein n=1 Tax=Saccharothrix saharensis TaxID=571190 RepID=A0A543JPJ3_9PSEU|nr:class I SAM-dependent methyltransferase [Saccharothrix saharensis]TQM84694.1 methyltransferase family protein [Saccharothrix saharensis]
MDVPRGFTIRESDHRIHNPLGDAKPAVLGRALRPRPGRHVLDLACGSGGLLCTRARDHGLTGTGVDLCATFPASARARATELGVTDRVGFVHRDAAGHGADEPVDVAACVGATWIGDGGPGTVELLRRSLRPGGLLLVGHPFRRRTPPDRAAVEGSHATSRDDYPSLPGLLARVDEPGCDVVEVVPADRDTRDRYVAAQWLSTRRWLERNPDDEPAPVLRAELTTAPVRYARYEREYPGWGVFALMDR